MKEDLSISFEDYFLIIKERLGLIVSITTVVVIIATIISFFVIKPTYEATTSIIVGKPQTSDKVQTAQYTDVMMYQNLVKTYSEIAKSDLVSKEALNKLQGDLTLSQIKSSITVTPQTGTQILIIRSKSKDPKVAFDVINAISISFVECSKKVYPTGGDIQVMDTASIPKSPVSPNKKLNIAIGFFLGIVLSLFIVLRLEYLDNTIKTESDVERYIELPVLGVIPKVEEKK